MREPLEITALTAEATRVIGAALARALRQRTDDALVLGFEGDLGAGKTTLVGGLLHALGVSGAVRSPTYTLIEPYDVGGLRIYHLDLYRLAAPEELDSLGVRDLLHEGAVLLVEWPSKGGALLPRLDLEIHIRYEEGGAVGRKLRFAAMTHSGDKLLRDLVSAQPELSGVSH